MKSFIYISLVLVFCILNQNDSFATSLNGLKQEAIFTEVPYSAQAEMQSDLVKQKIFIEQKSIEASAMLAASATQQAMKALEKNNTEKALSALENASGKLDILLAKEPKPNLAPIKVTISVQDINATPETIKSIIQHAKFFLYTGKLQQARALLAGLGSEINIQVTSIPLGTYPEAIKSAASLIHQGRIEVAKFNLNASLNTLVLTQHIIPLPYLRSLFLLKKIETLSKNKNWSETENQEIMKMLCLVHDQIDLADVLTYGSNQDYKWLYKQLNNVEEKIKKREPVKTEFDTIQKYLQNLINKISS